VCTTQRRAGERKNESVGRSRLDATKRTVNAIVEWRRGVSAMSVARASAVYFPSPAGTHTRAGDARLDPHYVLTDPWPLLLHGVLKFSWIRHRTKEDSSVFVIFVKINLKFFSQIKI
jgi:hypothetical protein